MTTTTEPTSTNSVLLHPYIVGLDKPLGRHRVSPAYFLLSLIVAALMILLPLIYVGLIGLVGYLLYWHVTHNAAVVTVTRHWLSLLVIYIGPIVAGAITILFMLKPLFARRQVQYRPTPISRKDQPLFVAYIERLCEVVGAPKPTEIHINMDLNAAAGFTGFFSGVIGGKMMLVVGLPLAAGMSLREFTGVLSHEFGHFAQRGGMRLNYFIRSINVWFARVVYENDAWDQTLHELSKDGGHWIIQIIALLARGAVWLSRRVLWLLMVIGEIFSRMLLRAKEFDADTYSARVIGSNPACDTLRKLPILELAIRATYEDLTSALAERKLPENIPQLVINRMQEMPADVRDALRRKADTEKTGWLSTHPSQLDRTTAIMALRAPGVFQAPDASASSLFTDFDMLSRIMTLQFYREQIPERLPGIEFVPVAAIEKKREAIQKQAETFESFFANLVDLQRPIYFSLDALPRDEQAKVEELLAVRKRQMEMMPAAQAAVAPWSEESSDLLACEVMAGLWANRIVISGSTREQNEAKREKLAASTKKSREPLDAALKLALRRVQLALSLAAPKKKISFEGDDLDFADDPDDPTEKLIGALNVLEQAALPLAELRTLTIQQRVLISLLSKNRENQNLIETILSRARRQIEAIDRLRQIFHGIPYPFAGKSKTTIETFVISHPASIQDLVGVINAAHHTLTQTQYLYARSLAALAEKCEKIEDDLGLSRMKFPSAPTSNN